MCKTLRQLAPLFVLVTVAYPATITEGGFLPATPLGTGAETVPIYLDSFNTHLGVLNSAVITLTLDADFQATIFAIPAPPLSSPVDLIGYTATLLPGFLSVGGTPIAGGPVLQSSTLPSVAVAGSVVVLSTVSPPEQIIASISSPLLSSLELPASGIPIPIQLETPGILFTPTTPQTIVLSGFGILEADYVAITYNYTPLLGSPAPTSAPEPMPQGLVMGALLIGFLFCGFFANFRAA